MDARLTSIEEKLFRIEERLHSLVEINNRLVHENIRKSMISPVAVPAVVPSVVPTVGIQIEKFTDTRFKVTGKTYPHRSIMRDANGEWDKVSMCWTFHVDHKETLVSLLEENNIEFMEIL